MSWNLAGRMRRDRTHRVASGAVMVLAVVGILSASAPPLCGRLDPVLDVLPLAAPLGAQTVLVPVSVALLLLARGLRLGARLAWAVCAGLLLPVARFADGRPAGFVQWVPSADIGGYSLDVMRRSTAPDVPNGLTDSLIVAAAEHLAGRGMHGLGLNVAVLREVVAGERAGTMAGIGRRALRTLSHRSQIESSWKFNAKYDPRWRACYVVLDALGSAAAQSLAIADAEGVTELPGLGRLLRRPTPAATGPVSP